MMLTPWIHWRMTVGHWWKHQDHEAWVWAVVIVMVIVAVIVLTVLAPVKPS